MAVNKISCKNKYQTKQLHIVSINGQSPSLKDQKGSVWTYRTEFIDKKIKKCDQPDMNGSQVRTMNFIKK